VLVEVLVLELVEVELVLVLVLELVLVDVLEEVEELELVEVQVKLTLPNKKSLILFELLDYDPDAASPTRPTVQSQVAIYREIHHLARRNPQSILDCRRVIKG